MGTSGGHKWGSAAVPGTPAVVVCGNRSDQRAPTIQRGPAAAMDRAPEEVPARGSRQQL